MNVQLIGIDWQNDFCVADDGHGNKGALVVPGGSADAERVAKMIGRVGPKIDDIHITLDSHQSVSIERPTWWKNAKDGTMPTPFTLLGVDASERIVALDPVTLALTDVEFTTFRPSYYNMSRDYIKALAAGGRYLHCVWPIHCVVGTWGFSLVPSIADALGRWECEQRDRVNYITKGNNPLTEHYSAVKAEVPDPTDPSTQVNTALIQTLEEADIVAITGQALSHCVANTVRDIADLFSDPKYIKKLVLLEDASSNVAGFEQLGADFVTDLTQKGMQLSNTVDFLS